MKYVLILFFLIITLNSFSQFIQEQSNNDPKPDYKYILTWRTWESRFVYHGDVGSIEMRWDIHFEGFNTIKQIKDWLNVEPVQWANFPEQHHDISPRITSNEFIALYDLIKGKKLMIDFKTTEKSLPKKSLPKRIEIQAESWKETIIEIKDN